MPDDILTRLTVAIITRLHDAGVGDDTDAPPPHNTSLPQLSAKVLPLEVDRSIAVTVYSRTASPNLKLKNVALSVQLMIRGAPDDRFGPDRIASAAYDALHGQHHVTWGGLQIDRCAHSFGSPMGPDDLGRYEWSDNYTVVLQQRSTP